MSYKDVQELHKQELITMGVNEDELDEILRAEEEFGVDYRQTLELARTNPSALQELIDDDEMSGFEYEGSDGYEEAQV